MQFRIVVVGRPRDAGLASLIHDYESRAGRYWPVTVTEVREEPGRRGTESSTVIAREGDRLLAAAAGRIITCDARGRTLDSHAFAAWIQQLREDARDVSFVIGGANGLATAVLDAAESRLALAPWTLPHEIARLVLAEQLYRAGTIGRGEPYHK
ncbi:MAG TPA: 23S rRNA (pseudouridine(1915)-N(3))-methyltransferase RlmH [Gemmatimonadaceae bacterium]|nr:23S rRNA (pseudouridine(1915)-N(3))-methyltransferase RlmH [Gemmatimonadaceae bacterium]